MYNEVTRHNEAARHNGATRHNEAARHYEIDLDKIDINAEPPTEEPARQYYFMAKCREWVRDFERKNGRLPKSCVTTFGCPNV